MNVFSFSLNVALLLVAGFCLASADYEKGTLGHDEAYEINRAILDALNEKKTSPTQIFALRSTEDQKAETILQQFKEQKTADTYGEHLKASQRRDVAFFYLSGFNVDANRYMVETPSWVVNEVFSKPYGLTIARNTYRTFLSLGPTIFAPTIANKDRQMVGILVRKSAVMPGDIVIIVVFEEPKIDAGEVPEWIPDYLAEECGNQLGSFCEEPNDASGTTKFLACVSGKAAYFKATAQAALPKHPKLRGTKPADCKDKMDLRMPILIKVCTKAKVKKTVGSTKFEDAVKNGLYYNALCF